jgi:predicted CoA-binding protein
VSELSAASAKPLSALLGKKTIPRAGLESLFLPRTAAVIGATDRPGAVGRSVTNNLLESKFLKKIFVVNPTRDEVLGIPSYKRVQDIPQPLDLAVVMTPADTVPQIISDCVDAEVKSAVVISAGFREQGAAGASLEEEIKQHLRRGSLRMLGPNCMGFMNPTVGLNATFAKTISHKGSVAFLSQSGALQTAILDWSEKEHVGFSAIVSTGSMLSSITSAMTRIPKASWCTWNRLATRALFCRRHARSLWRNQSSSLKQGAPKQPRVRPRPTLAHSLEAMKSWRRLSAVAVSCECRTSPISSTWLRF